MSTPPTLFPKSFPPKSDGTSDASSPTGSKFGSQPSTQGGARLYESPFKSAAQSPQAGGGPAPSPLQSAGQTTPASPATPRPASAFRSNQQAPAAGQTPQTPLNRAFRSFAKPAEKNEAGNMPGAPFGGGTTQRPASLLRGQQATEPLRSTVTPSGVFRPQGQTVSTFRSTSPFRKDLQISDEEFIQLRDFIYLQCGIFIAENRKYLVENRLSNRIKELNLKSYSEYYNYLRFDASRRTELNKLFEVVTTNETSFFRNPPQLEVFQKSVIPEILEQCRKSGRKRLRIWSAGCSTGEEPYTLAIILHEVLKSDIRTWDIKITANDLSEAVLAAARRGIYNEYALRTTPKEIIDAYFTKDGGVYKINPMLKHIVSFGQINLSDREQLKRVEKSQIVFCRNVIIYFDDEMKRKVINAFYDNLEPNGALLIGHSESLHNISRAFQLEHHKGTIVYRKIG